MSRIVPLAVWPPSSSRAFNLQSGYRFGLSGLGVLGASLHAGIFGNSSSRQLQLRRWAGGRRVASRRDRPSRAAMAARDRGQLIAWRHSNFDCRCEPTKVYWASQRSIWIAGVDAVLSPKWLLAKNVPDSDLMREFQMGGRCRFGCARGVASVSTSGCRFRCGA